MNCCSSNPIVPGTRVARIVLKFVRVINCIEGFELMFKKFTIVVVTCIFLSVNVIIKSMGKRQHLDQIVCNILLKC